mmetsp:Transcript_7284/g.19078  ORF Transcript_7284/g.19078 Transcript_7284/m.19078 type:complete len:212 (+) Transcript_7284:239-874(+)
MPPVPLASWTVAVCRLGADDGSAPARWLPAPFIRSGAACSRSATRPDIHWTNSSESALLSASSSLPPNSTCASPSGRRTSIFSSPSSPLDEAVGRAGAFELTCLDGAMSAAVGHASSSDSPPPTPTPILTGALLPCVPSFLFCEAPEALRSSLGLSTMRRPSTWNAHGPVALRNSQAVWSGSLVTTVPRVACLRPPGGSEHSTKLCVAKSH